MDFPRSFKIFLAVASLLIELSLCIPWYKDVGQGDMLNSLNSPYLSAAYDSFYGERERIPKSISKRSTDWSNRQSSSSGTASKLSPETQESENIEMSTKLPRVIRKVRLQNVPQQFKRFDQNGIHIDQSNGTVTSDKRGRIVRVKKFRKRTTTTKPVVSIVTSKSIASTTTVTRSTTARPGTLRQINFVRQTTSGPSKSTSDYSHITVINKEYVHQKPNRKNRNKNMNRIWVPTSTFGSNSIQKESNDVTSHPYPTESEIKKQRSESTFDAYQSKNKEFGAYMLSPDSHQRSRSNRQITNPENGSKMEKEIISEPLNTRRTMSENKQKSHHQASLKQSFPAGSSQNMKEINSHQTNNPNSVPDTTPMPAIPKSFEVLKDDLHVQNNSVSQNITHSSLKTNDSHLSGISEGVPLSFGREIPFQPQTNSQQEQRFPEPQFGQFPPRESSIFQRYPYENINPYFRSSQQQTPRMPPIQTDNPLSPTNFRQPFTPFNKQNGLQFRDHFPSSFQSSPYRRREGLARPDFYQSPQLASLRRSIIEEAYSDEEVTEPTTEFSIPKFEIPSIDFNDKGCRTVYKEVRAIPSDGINEETQESNAKSFIMTRECYFPDGVPTVKPVSEKEYTENVTSPTREI